MRRLLVFLLLLGPGLLVQATAPTAAPTVTPEVCNVCLGVTLDNTEVAGWRCVDANGDHAFHGDHLSYTQSSCSSPNSWYHYTCHQFQQEFNTSSAIPVTVCDAFKADLEPICCASPTAQPTKDTHNDDLDMSDAVSNATNTTLNYYSAQITADNIPDYYLGRLECPGKSVCLPDWVGNGHCDDCFGCDQYMVATGIYGDCSTCWYFWSGGKIGKGTFDGGDCGDFTFPSAINNKLFDDCLLSGEFRTTAQLAHLDYRQKRNTIIAELVAGGWGTAIELQDDTDPRLAAKCYYANFKECLRNNGWWKVVEMRDWVKGDRKFEVATRLAMITPYDAIDLVEMTDKALLEECIAGGIHQKIVGFAWMTDLALSPLTADQKRNHAINRLYGKGKGAVHQLQAMDLAQLRFMLNYVDA